MAQGFALKIGGFGTAQAGSGFSSSQAPTTATEAGFGQAYTDSGSPSGLSALAPNDPSGVAIWVGVGSLILLLWIRHNLPR